MNVQIEAVVTNRALNTFIDVPWSLYRHDPCWVPPLRFDRRSSLSPKHPFFRHAQWQGYVAYVNGSAVGRISAQVDRLNDDAGRAELGYFGLIEAIDEPAVFDALFRAAEGWLRDQGRTRVVGPVSLGMNQEVGLLVDGFETPPYFLMGHALPYYGSRIDALGYRKATDLFAYEMDPNFEIPRIMASVESRLADRMRIRPIDGKRIDEDLTLMREIFNDAWANNWGAVPFTLEEFLAIGREMLLITPKDLIQIAEVDGEPAAFIVMLPNLNEVIADLDGKVLPLGWAKLLWRLKVRFPTSARVPLMGVRQKYQRTRLGPGLAFAVIHAARNASVARGVRSVEMSWILEDNQGMRNIIETIGGHVSKRYRIYERQIGPTD